MTLQRSIEEILTRELEELGYELVAAEYMASGRRGLLRIFIDREDASITIDDCVRVTKGLSIVLDSMDEIPGPYTLEVSSPGLSRPLVKPKHFERFMGNLARVSYIDNTGSKVTVIGVISGVSESDVMLNVDGKDRNVPFDRMLRANLEQGRPEKARHSGRRGKRRNERF